MTTKCRKHINIDYRTGAYFFLRMWTHIDNAARQGRIKPFKGKPRKDLGEIALAIDVKLKLLAIVINRMNKNILKLYEQIRERDKSKDKYAMPVPDEITYTLITDIDSFLFEMSSCLELLDNYAKKVLRKVCGKKIPKKFYIDSVLQEHGKGKWPELLQKTRNHFVHQAAPWIAVCVDKEPSYDLLIMKQNLHDFNDTDQFLRLTDLNKISKKFTKTIDLVAKHLEQEVKSII